MPGGRPSKYDPAFCEQVVPFMADGYSVAALAGHLGVAVSTVYLWMEEHQEFSDAVKDGQAAAALWWENRLRKNAETGDGNATSCIFGLKNRAPKEWRDRKEVDHSSEDGSMTPTTIIIKGADGSGN